ncbi:F510_1955 family glycosylhydrolase [Neobacillus sp. SM06]|uniref:F510_1955 family glycosylhydrolase n=1 Tax=Neobacillus sp. SM06 TaxID=3422492 RepID=UPI003D2D6064
MIYKKRLAISIFAGVLVFTSGCASNSEKKAENTKSRIEQTAVKPFQIVPGKSQTLDHIHGIGYPGNDEALYVAAHDGISMYKRSKWYETTTNHHDYMGFQAIATGFQASGHPENGSTLKNPLGLVESLDQGKTVKKLAFYGQSDFHYMASSYSANGIYVINEQQNGKWDPGIYYSNDNGKNWSKTKLEQFAANSFGMMAVHPNDGQIMAMATRTGIYYSENHGDTMKLVSAPVMVTALTFTGDQLLYSSVVDKKILLKRLNPKTGAEAPVGFPFLDYDNPVTYIAVDPKNTNRLAFSTYKNDIYESTDGGKSWVNLVKDGKMEQE